MNPFCVECEREHYTTVAKEVDHRTPVAEGGNIFDIDNCQALCKSHHSQKTWRETKHKRL